MIPKLNPTKDKLLKVIADKDELEAKIRDYGAVLEANGGVGMNGTLVDADGFPRNDIDVYQVRQARQQIICLQNDHKELMKLIEQLMHQLHAQTAGDEQQQDLTLKTSEMQLNSPTSIGNVSSSMIAPELKVIVKVNLVSPGSPAEEAGLCVGDKILQFGTINSNNFNNNINQIGTLVQHMKDKRIALKLERGNQFLDLVLIPKLWSGRGLLGCNIVLPDVVE